MIKPSLARITITIPAPVLAAADELAARLDRSRSWVLVEAVRRLVAAEPLTTAPPDTPPEATAQLRDRLKRSLALTPSARVRAAEEGARVAQRAGGPSPSQRIRGFTTLQEYEQWRSAARAPS